MLSCGIIAAFPICIVCQMLMYISCNFAHQVRITPHSRATFGTKPPRFKKTSHGPQTKTCHGTSIHEPIITSSQPFRVPRAGGRGILHGALASLRGGAAGSLRAGGRDGACAGAHGNARVGARGGGHAEQHQQRGRKPGCAAHGGARPAAGPAMRPGARCAAAVMVMLGALGDPPHATGDPPGYV